MAPDSPENALVPQTQHLEDLRAFESSLLNHVQSIGLPTANVLVNLEERFRVFANLEAAVSRLRPADRGRSIYVSNPILKAML
jgi:hypothetical protein